MNFKEIIKQEWEKEFLFDEEGKPAEFSRSIYNTTFGVLTRRICERVWNEALELAAEEVDVEDYYGTNVPDRNSILKFKL